MIENVFLIYSTLLFVIFPLLIDIFMYIYFKPKIELYISNYDTHNIILNFLDFIHHRYRKLLGFKNRMIIITFDIILALSTIALAYYTGFNIWFLLVLTILYLCLISLIRYNIYYKLIKDYNSK